MVHVVFMLLIVQLKVTHIIAHLKSSRGSTQAGSSGHVYYFYG